MAKKPRGYGGKSLIFGIGEIKIEPVQLTFNKPYFFMVYDKVDEQPVFAGIINNPQWQG